MKDLREKFYYFIIFIKQKVFFLVYQGIFRSYWSFQDLVSIQIIGCDNRAWFFFIDIFFIYLEKVREIFFEW